MWAYTYKFTTNIFLFVQDTGHCIWYDICSDPKAPKTQYCSYNGTAKALDQDGQKLLSKWCPHLLEKDQGLACCNNQMVSLILYIIQFQHFTY